MRIKQTASALNNKSPNINNWNLPIYSRGIAKAFEESADGSAFIFLRWFKHAHICRPIHVTGPHKGDNQAY